MVSVLEVMDKSYSHFNDGTDIAVSNLDIILYILDKIIINSDIDRDGFKLMVLVISFVTI